MTGISDLNLTAKQIDALGELGVTEIESIDGEVINKLDGRLRQGVATRLEEWKMRDGVAVAEPEDVEEIVPEYRGLTFGDRLAAIREARSYVRKLTKHGMDYSAVLFDDLLQQVRDLFLRYGISWHTHDTRVEVSRTHDREGLLIMEDLMVFTFRFQCVEGSPAPRSAVEIGAGDWYRDVIVPARSFDVYDKDAEYPQGDKGPGKAHTYGQKLALRILLNLPAGDDPDFTPAASLGARARAERENLVGRLRATLNKAGHDVEKKIETLLKRLADHHRAVDSVQDVPDSILQGWIRHFEKGNGDGDGDGS